MRTYMSSGQERGGDGTGTLLAETRAAEAVREARRILAETEQSDGWTDHLTAGAPFASGHEWPSGWAGAERAALAESLAAFVAE